MSQSPHGKYLVPCKGAAHALREVPLAGSEPCPECWKASPRKREVWRKRAGERNWQPHWRSTLSCLRHSPSFWCPQLVWTQTCSLQTRYRFPRSPVGEPAGNWLITTVIHLFSREYKLVTWQLSRRVLPKSLQPKFARRCFFLTSATWYSTSCKSLDNFYAFMPPNLLFKHVSVVRENISKAD